MHLRFLVPKNGNSPNGYLGDGEVNVTTGQTKQVVEETARAGVKNWLDSKMGVIDMQVWKPQAPFDTNNPSLNKCTRLDSDESLGVVTNRSCLIVIPTVQRSSFPASRWSLSNWRIVEGNLRSIFWGPLATPIDDEWSRQIHFLAFKVAPIVLAKIQTYVLRLIQKTLPEIPMELRGLPSVTGTKKIASPSSCIEFTLEGRHDTKHECRNLYHARFISTGNIGQVCATILTRPAHFLRRGWARPGTAWV